MLTDFVKMEAEWASLSEGAAADRIATLEDEAVKSAVSRDLPWGVASNSDGIECKAKRIHPKCGERIAKVHYRFTFKKNGKRITRNDLLNGGYW